MSIRYALYENYLTPDPNDYAAHVEITASADLDAIVSQMVAQGSTVTRPDILAVLENAITATEALLLEGYRINFGGLVDLYPRLTGVFNGITDTFDPARHRVDVGGSPGARVRKAVRANARVEKVESTKPAPTPLEYTDTATGERNATITGGNIASLAGNRLKFDPTKADEGIYFVPVDGDPAIKVTVIQKNKPGELVFLNPAAIGAADYHLEVRARMANSKELRMGRLDAVLTVP